MSVIINRVC